MVRQIHEWSWKLVRDRRAEAKTSSVKTKTKTAKNRSRAVSRPRPRSQGLQDCHVVVRLSGRQYIVKQALCCEFHMPVCLSVCEGYV